MWEKSGPDRAAGLGGGEHGRPRPAEGMPAGGISAASNSRFCFRRRRSTVDPRATRPAARPGYQPAQAGRGGDFCVHSRVRKELSQLKSNFRFHGSRMNFRTPARHHPVFGGNSYAIFHAKMQPAEHAEQLESITRNTGRMGGAYGGGSLVLSRFGRRQAGLQSGPARSEPLFCHRIVDEVLSATNRRCVIELSLASVPRAEAESGRAIAPGIFLRISSVTP